MIPRSVRRMFDERSEPREPAQSQAAVLELGGRRHRVRLANISASGAMVIVSAMPHIGEQVVLDVMDRGRVNGRVLWVKDGRIGVQFAAPLE
ncbi:MAG TPA: PilZ domain-containing protein [Sphingomicrobium sp.]|nr:PilZ domain-containing protein [Sphingomicrobium sp.]